MNGVSLGDRQFNVLKASIDGACSSSDAGECVWNQLRLPFWNARVEYIQQLHRLEDVSFLLTVEKARQSVVDEGLKTTWIAFVT